MLVIFKSNFDKKFAIFIPTKFENTKFKNKYTEK